MINFDGMEAGIYKLKKDISKLIALQTCIMYSMSMSMVPR